MKLLLLLLVVLGSAALPSSAQSDVTFSPVATLTTGDLGPSSIVLADVAGSPLPDVVVATAFGNLRIFVNLGGNVFAAPTVIVPVDFSFEAVRAADLDADGDIDIVLASTTVTEVLINGGGTFTSNVFSYLGDGFIPSASDLHVIDLNQDGNLDIVRRRSALLGQGGGAFALGNVLPLPPGSLIQQDFADFDGDGDLDRAALMQNQDGIRVYVTQNGGTGSLLGDTLLGEVRAVGGGRIMARELTGDSIVDIVVSLGSGQNPLAFPSIWEQTFEGTASGSFIPKAPRVRVGMTRLAQVAADFDLDGDLDLLGPGADSFGPLVAGELNVRRNRGDGVFEDGGVSTFPAAGVPFGRPSVGDLDGDGDIDVVECVRLPATGGYGVLTFSPAFSPASAAPVRQISIIGGQNQLALPMSIFAQQLSVLVTDTSGAPVAGASVTFYESAAEGRLLPMWQAGAITNAFGVASMSVATSTILGAGSIRAFASIGVEATFSLVVGFPQQLVKVSGDGQATDSGEAFRDPLVVRLVDPSGAPIIGYPVVFSIANPMFGSIVGNATVFSDAQGLAQANVAPGAAGGEVVVSVTAGSGSVGFSLFTRRLTTVVNTALTNLLVQYRHEHASQAVILAFDQPQAAPVVTPYGSIWTTILAPGPSLVALDPPGSFGLADPALVANPILIRSYVYPPSFSGMILTAQVYGFDPFYWPDLSLAVFVSNPVTKAL